MAVGAALCRYSHQEVPSGRTTRRNMGIKLVRLRYLRVSAGTSARVVRFAEKGAVWRTVCHDLTKNLPPRVPVHEEPNGAVRGRHARSEGADDASTNGDLAESGPARATVTSADSVTTRRCGYFPFR